MKTKTTPEKILAIAAALESLGEKLFRQESGDPKYNAQRNLNGRTHCVDDDTLRWHKSRVCSTSHLHGGLLFRVTCSDALDMNGTRRGFRSAVFDVFGTVIDRPKLEDAATTSEKAIRASMDTEIDLVAHYRDAIKRKLEWNKQEKAKLSSALRKMPRK